MSTRAACAAPICWCKQSRLVRVDMSKFIAALLQPLSIVSMSLAWLFCLGYFLTAIHVLPFSAPLLLAGWPPGLFFGLQAGTILLLEFDHWRAYYGVGALWRELGALVGLTLLSWLIAQVWPLLAARDTPLQTISAWLVIGLVLMAPFLASQGSYLLLGEPLNFQQYLRR